MLSLDPDSESLAIPGGKLQIIILLIICSIAEYLRKMYFLKEEREKENIIF